ncbi:MAG: DMT family transporter [Candidatus Babeliaceae bacterium]|nr:DMT family transporter [Candidatus Babeliaceae bacterium]
MLDILLAYIFLAAGIVSNKYILASISAEFFVALRMLISGSFLMMYNLHQTERLSYRQVKNNHLKLLLIAACTTLIPSLLKAWSLKHMLASKQSLLGSIDPFVTALMVYVLFSEKITRSKMLGMVIGFIGVVVIILSKGSHEPGYELLFRISLPELAIICAVIISRYGWILVQTLLRNKHYTPVQINGLVQVIAGFLALCLATYNNQLKLYAITSYSNFIMAFLCTIIGGNIIGYTLYSYSLKHHSATFVSLAGFLIPLLVAFFAYIFLGENISWSLLVGGLIIFMGLSIFYIGEKMPKFFKKS